MTITNEQAREFFESFPLLQKMPVTFPVAERKIIGPGPKFVLPQPSIKYDCPQCGSVQTFRQSDDYDTSSVHPHGVLATTVFACAGCTDPRTAFTAVYHLEAHLKEGWVRKLGQVPPWEIGVERELRKALGKQAVFYAKGLVCESQAYGIGAFSYYRRVIEDLLEQILSDVEAVLEGKELQDFRAAAKLARGSKRAAEKLDLVKDALPAHLRPGGVNPLGMMYGVLSEGMHSKTDEECLDAGQAMRMALSFLVKRISTIREDRDSFAKALGSLRKPPEDATRGA